MNASVFVPVFVCLTLLSMDSAWAQSSPVAAQSADDIALMKQQMLQMQDGLRQMQAQHRKEVAELKAQVQSLQKTVHDFQKTMPAGAASPAVAGPATTAAAAPKAEGATAFPTTDTSVVAEGVPAAAPAQQAPASATFPTTDESVTTAPAATPATGLTRPLTILGGGKTYMNISFDGQFSLATSTDKHLENLETGDHDPQQRGFNARNLELALDGAVDPYFEGFANIVFKLDNENETSVEVEEAFMQTTTLPWDLQAKGGQFFAPLGRINAQHPHVWDFVDVPLVEGRLLGPDGLRGLGAQIAWLVPVPWYSQLVLAAQNGNGGTGFSFRNRGQDDIFYGRNTIDRGLGGVEDMVFIPRIENSFDLSSTQTLLVGVSGAFGPNDTGTDTSTRIYGADVFYKWKSSHAEGGWPFVKWQTEALLRQFDAGRGADDSFPVHENFDDYGAYSQVVWGFHKGWTAGLRGDYLHMEESMFTDDPQRQSRWRGSPEVTWYPTEFSKFRLQYNHDYLESNRFLSSANEDSVFLQFEFALGAHAAHKF